MRCKEANSGGKCSSRDQSFQCQSGCDQNEQSHNGDRPFQCSQCEKATALSSDLQGQAATKSGKRSHQCSYCSKNFAQGSRLRRHESTHTGVKPYKCNQCNKCFGDSSHLKRHTARHTVEKPFKCSEGNKCFAPLKIIINMNSLTQMKGPSFSKEVQGKNGILNHIMKVKVRVTRQSQKLTQTTQNMIPAVLKIIYYVIMNRLMLLRNLVLNNHWPRWSMS